MSRLAYLPVVEDREQLNDLVSRAAWYLGRSPVEKMFVFVADPRLADAEWEVAPGVDPSIGKRFPLLRELIEFVPASRPADLAPIVRDATMVLRFRRDALPEWLPDAKVEEWLAKKQVFDVDANAARTESGNYEAANYITVNHRLMGNKKAAIAENREKFEEVARGLGRFERAILLATGPSVKQYARFDFEGALGIVCNTVILDKALMEAVRPKFVVFTDPNFHFGPSQYAGSFRDSVRAAAERFDFTI
jgi:hypothetical protein